MYSYSSYSQTCTTPILAPFSEGFENDGLIPDCWTNTLDNLPTGANVDDYEDWRFELIGQGPGNQAHVGNGGDLSGTTITNNYFAYADASGTDEGILISPMIDMTALTVPALSFYEISDKEDSVNSRLTVDVWDGAVWNTVAVFETNTNGWEQRVIDLSGLTFTGNAQIRFGFTEPNSGFDDDIAIDDVMVGELPSCINPITPIVSNITGTTVDITWTDQGSSASTNIELVNISDGEMFTGVATGVSATNVYNATGLSASSNYEYYIQADCGTSVSDWIGPYTFQTDILCFSPTNIFASNVTLTSADITWTDDASSTSDSVIEIGLQGFTPGTGAELVANTSSTGSLAVTTLTMNTVYDVYVRTNCGTDGYSLWSEATTFCSGYGAPYTETFENSGDIPNCWTMTGDEDWEFHDDGEPGNVGTNGVLTGVSASGGYYATVDASGSGGDIAYLFSPFVDVTTLTTPALSFYEISDSQTSANSTITVDVWDGAIWNTVGVYDTDTLGWERRIIDLTSYTFTGLAQVRFTFEEIIDPSGSRDDRAIDDVSFMELPSCLPTSSIAATNITEASADLTWTEYNGSTSWEIVIQEAGLTAPSMGTVTSTNPYAATSLMSGVTYEVFVRTDCGGAFSDWTSSEFTTTPTNDDCMNAIPLTVGTIYSDNPLDASLAGSTYDGMTTTCQDNTSGSIWYSLVVPANGSVIVETGDDSNAEFSGYDVFDTVIEVYSGVCGSLVALDCIDQVPGSGGNYSKIILTGQTAGDVLYVRVWGSNTNDPYLGFGIAAHQDPETLSVDDNTFEELLFTYFPNPIKNILTLNAKKAIENVDIYNMLGQNVMSSRPNTNISKLDVSNLQTGTYFVKVKIANATKTIRVIKQ